MTDPTLWSADDCDACLAFEAARVLLRDAACGGQCSADYLIRSGLVTRTELATLAYEKLEARVWRRMGIAPCDSREN